MARLFLSIFLWLMCSLGPLYAQNIFYTDAGDWVVKSADTNGINSNIQTIVSAQPDLVPGKIAVDNINNKIYFSDFYGDRIFRVNTFSSFVEELVTGTDHPRGIALDVENNTMYWVSKNSHLMESADLDGNNRSQILDNTALQLPDNLRIDLQNQKLYWNGTTLDSSKDVIQRCDLDGQNVETVVIANSGDIWGFDIVPSSNELYYFWADTSSQDYVRIASTTLINQDASTNAIFHDFGLSDALIQDITVDTTTSKIFWTDTYNNLVGYRNLAPLSLVQTLIDQDVNHIQGFALSNATSELPTIIITEVMQDPTTVSDANGEWFEIYNPTEHQIDLSGWKIKDNGSDLHVIDPGSNLSIPAYGFLVLGINADTTANGNVEMDYQYSNFLLTNSNDEIILTLDDDSVIDSVAYGGGWPLAAGTSMVLNDLRLDNNDPANWSNSLLQWTLGNPDKGSPGYFANGNPQNPPAGGTQEYGFGLMDGTNPVFALTDLGLGNTVIDSFRVYLGEKNPNLGENDKAIGSYLELHGTPDGATLTMYYTDALFEASGLSSEEELQLAAWDGFTWFKYPRGPGSNVTTNIVTAEGVFSFSEWVIVGSDSDSPLPVELTSFSGTLVENGVRLNWRTLSETDNAGFILYRNGEVIASYETSDELKGQGTKSTATNYQYVDQSVELGTMVYSIESQDLSGLVHKYNPVVELKVSELQNPNPKDIDYNLSQNYPNPFNPSTNITYTMKEAGFATIKVYDLLGRIVFKTNIPSGQGVNTFLFNASKFTTGMYFYQMSAKNYTSPMKRMVLIK